MVEIKAVYNGDLHCNAVHQPSGSVIETDAPKDNMGKGEKFSPTDLLATALGTCVLTVMGIAARKINVDIKGTTATVQKEMQSVPVRRIAKLIVNVTVPMRLSEEHKEILAHAALNCPVHKSLHPEIHAPIEFSWG